MPEASRPAFDSYALPLSRRREGSGPAAALSLLAHIAIAILVLWRGATLFASGGGGGSTGPRGGGGGGGQPAMSWVALPPLAAASAEHDVVKAEPTPPPVVTVPTVTPPPAEPVKIDVPLTTQTTPPVAVGTGNGTTGGPGSGPGSGGGQGTGTGTGVGSDSGPGSGGGPSGIIPSPKWAILPPSGAPREMKGRPYEVQFWVTAEGRVTRVEVTPPIKDSGYRRDFVDRMMGYQFNPARTLDGRPIDGIARITLTLP
jgi:protein TonB